MKKTLSLLLFNLFLCAFGQLFTAFNIPESLRKDAYAVIRKDDVEVNILAANKITRKKDFIITVVDKSGVQFAQPVEFYNPRAKITNLEATFYDEFGLVLKKFKEKDFIDQSHISGGQMYTENRVKYLTYVPNRYPYTVHIKSEMTHSNTWISPWNPITSNNLGIESSTYTLKNPKNLKLYSKEMNLKEFGITPQGTQQETIYYELKNQKPFEQEDHLPVYSSIFPNVEFSSHDFEIDGVRGSFSNWSEMGKWYNLLLNNANDLTPTQKSYFQNLVKDAKSDREKVQILYKHLQGKTRYIGVQLGIGGLRPFPASYVESKSYGDCKALSNYMQSILQAVGIPSYYVVVQAGRREDFHTDFASIAQGNHVILYVPLKEEDIWLETTSQQTAFNYLGSFTDNRNVLAIYPDGGKLIKTPKYPSDKNTETTKGKFEVLGDGRLTGNFQSVFGGIQYEQNFRIFFENQKEQKKELMDEYGILPNLNIKNYELKNNWEEAIFTKEIELESLQFGKIFGNNMSINILPIGIAGSNLKKNNNRVHPFEIGYGNSDHLEFEIKIPAMYKIDGKLEPVVLNSEFGSYELILETLPENKINIIRKLSIKEGIYPKEKYNDYVEFRRKIASFDNTKILLEKI
jgi:transglutaminase-like putative cysteine protease